MAPAAFREYGLAADQLHSRLEIRLWLSVAPHPHVPGGHAAHRAVLGIEHFGCREAGEDHHLERFRLFGEPAAQAPEADDVVAPVVHLGRRRQADRAPRGEEQEAVIDGRRVERRAALLPVRKQFVEGARFDDGPGEDVGADLGALLDEAHRKLPIVLQAELAKPDCRAQTGGTAADDDDIELHRLSFHPDHPRARPAPSNSSWIFAPPSHHGKRPFEARSHGPAFFSGAVEARPRRARRARDRAQKHSRRALDAPSPARVRTAAAAPSPTRSWGELPRPMYHPASGRARGERGKRARSPIN